MMDYVEKQADVFNRYGVDKYLCGLGLSVNPLYRSRGIATEIINARIPLLKHLGLTLTSTAFSAVGSAKAASKVGFVTDFEIT